MVDEVPVPDRLEQTVGEAERKDVQRGFLAEEVVDPEDLPLLEGLVDRSFRVIALCRSVPKAFHTTREPTGFASRRVLMTLGAATGGTLR